MGQGFRVREDLGHHFVLASTSKKARRLKLLWYGGGNNDSMCGLQNFFVVASLVAGLGYLM